MKKLLQTLFFFLLVTQICFAQGSWTQIGYMPEIRYAHTVNELNGKIYVVGGLNTETGISPRTALVYDTLTRVWTQIPLYNNIIRWAHTSCVVDGKLYVIGGNDGNGTIATMDMFDPNTGQWESKDSMSIDRGLAASASIDGKIYVMGGMRFNGGSYDFTGLKTIEAYDPLTNTWDSTLADMPTKRWGHSAVALNGKIYVIGGTTITPNFAYASVEVYDPQSNTWSTKSDMPTARYCLTACSLDGNIYAIDGWLDSGNGPIYDKVEVYNPDSSTWYTETPMPVARAVLASIVLDGKIQVFGGSSTTHPLIGTSGIYEFTPPPVPVELTSFTAISNGKEVILNWSTATELNNFEFEVQRSFEGSEFFTVGVVYGKGTTTERQDYTYCDKNLSDGKYSYRLKQVDYDGSFEYSDVIEVDFRAFKSFLLEQNFPNPFNPITTIGFGLQSKSNVKITILNSIGEEVAVVLNEEKESGFHQVEFNAANLPSGVYFYQLNAGSFVETKKMVLLK